MPLDEAALAKAQYIEYYVRRSGAEPVRRPRLRRPVRPTARARRAVSPASGSSCRSQIDAQGNRWAVDRGVPSRLVRLDPRTGEHKAWDLPDKRAGVHDLIMDRQGIGLGAGVLADRGRQG